MIAIGCGLVLRIQGCLLWILRLWSGGCHGRVVMWIGRSDKDVGSSSMLRASERPHSCRLDLATHQAV